MARGRAPADLRAPAARHRWHLLPPGSLRTVPGKTRRHRDPGFAVFGMLAVQYTYFAAIKYSNAATGTVLQYLMPIVIVFYTALTTRKPPRPLELVCVLLAVAGTFLIVTHGNLSVLAISPAACFGDSCRPWPGLSTPSSPSVSSANGARRSSRAGACSSVACSFSPSPIRSSSRVYGTRPPPCSLPTSSSSAPSSPSSATLAACSTSSPARQGSWLSGAPRRHPALRLHPAHRFRPL